MINQIRNRIIILEGVDCSGKTQLKDELWLELEAHCVHYGHYPAIKKSYPRFYLEGMLPAINEQCNVIMDRSWLSEEPYGYAFRGGPPFRFDSADCRMLERVALTRDACIIYCDPGFVHIQSEFLKRMEDEYLDSVKQLKEVYSRYPARLNHSHLRWFHYDFHVHSIKDVVNFIMAVKDEDTSLDPPMGIGGHEAEVVLVGDEFANHSEWDCHQQFPFVSFGAGCSRWLACQLDKHNISERDLWWLNQDMLPENMANCSDLYTLDFLAEHNNVIALGDVAHAKLKEFSIKHTIHHHPAYWRRFKTDQDYPLIDELKEICNA